MKHTKAVKFTVMSAAAILIVSLALSFFPVRGEEKIYEDIIRLHVIASSDDAADQENKLAVRDALLSLISSYPVPKDRETAKDYLTSHLPELKRCAEGALRDRGSDELVEVSLGKEDYPVRYYEGFSLPAGTYTSLRVIIGEGEGHNWWCVLFPPLCTAAGTKEQREDFIAAGFTSEQYKLIEGGSGTKYKVRFKILEVLSEVFGFDY